MRGHVPTQSFLCLPPRYVQGTSTRPFLWIHFSLEQTVANRCPLFPNFFRKRIAFPPCPFRCPVVQRTLGCFLPTQPPCEREKPVLFALCALLPAPSCYTFFFFSNRPPLFSASLCFACPAFQPPPHSNPPGPAFLGALAVSGV